MYQISKQLIFKSQLDQEGFHTTFEAGMWKVPDGARVVARGQKKTLYQSTQLLTVSKRFQQLLPNGVGKNQLLPTDQILDLKNRRTMIARIYQMISLDSTESRIIELKAKRKVGADLVKVDQNTMNSSCPLIIIPLNTHLIDSGLPCNEFWANKSACLMLRQSKKLTPRMQISREGSRIIKKC